MKIFLDVGANSGQTMKAVLAFPFDRIVCFEPCSAYWNELESTGDGRVSVERFGLWNRTSSYRLYNSGTKGGSLWDRGRGGNDEICTFVKASDWFAANLSFGDTVFIKLNVEGAECDILDDLIDSGEFNKVTHIMVDFDVRKIESQRHRQAEVMARLAGVTFPRLALCKDVMKGKTHGDRIRHWLHLVGEREA